MPHSVSYHVKPDSGAVSRTNYKATLFTRLYVRFNFVIVIMKSFRILSHFLLCIRLEAELQEESFSQFSYRCTVCNFNGINKMLVFMFGLVILKCNLSISLFGCYSLSVFIIC